MIPLSLACRVGHVEVVLLLLQHGAKATPNTNGEYPIHIAAGAGHAQICRMLKDYPGWDIPDKYFEWTPVFHAARNGHLDCVKVLLELGSRLTVVDEMGKQAVFYAAWYGHLDCVRLLLQVLNDGGVCVEALVGGLADLACEDGVGGDAFFIDELLYLLEHRY